jgi:hypothetical protein
MQDTPMSMGRNEGEQVESSLNLTLNANVIAYNH